MSMEPKPTSADVRMAAWLDGRITTLEEDIKHMEGELAGLHNARAVMRQLQKGGAESMAAWEAQNNG